VPERRNVLIIGAGGVAHVAAHLAAQHNDVLGDICVASRTLAKAEAILDSVRRKEHVEDPSRRLHARQLDALDIDASEALIRETSTGIVVNLGTAFLNRSVLEACLRTGAAYLDTAIHEDPDTVCEDPPWYANHEWKNRDRCADAGVTAILGAGFDPGVVNAYAAAIARRHLDTVETIDIFDVNAGSHGRYFATNFDPEINFREFVKVWTYIDRKWQEFPTHAVKRVHDFPVVGPAPVYLTGHDELHSLASNIDADSIRFWMGFGDHYINVFTVLRTLGLLDHEPVVVDGVSEPVVPLKVVKAVLPDPMTLAPDYEGKTCIGVYGRGVKDGERRGVLLYQVSDHADCYRNVESQAISFTAGVPPIAAALLVADGRWDTGTMVNVEELDPEPFLELLAGMGLPTDVVELDPDSPAFFDGTVGALDDEIAAASATVTVSAADPMIAVRPPGADRG
jgi:saccharopine dehydrogenase-like NADP-dependent oxidoreductase